MKKIIVIYFLFLYAVFVNGQCIPNPIYQDSLFGLWPDTIQNLPNANAGVYYSTVLNLKTPTIVSEVVPPSQAYVAGIYIGNNTIDSITLVSVNGLPPGINLSCSNGNCSFIGDTVGCVDIFGTTNNIGQYPISFQINGWIHVSIFGVNIPFDLYGSTGSYQTITGYVLEVTPNFNISYQTSDYNSYEISCNGENDGFINLTIPNSNNYTYVWNGPNGFYSNQKDISNLYEGTYTYTVTDINGYSSTSSISLVSPPPISINTNINSPSCFGYNDGSVILAINGGNPSYTQNWFGNNPLSLSAGTYNYTVIDINGCSVNNNITITEPSLITVSENIIDVSCFGFSDGQVNLNINGGTPPYYEDWGIYNNLALPAGTYNYLVTDINGCSFIGNVSIIQPDDISVLEYIIDATDCYINDGEITLNISGGSLPYNINWNGFNPNALYAGNYSYTVQDVNNCIYTNTVYVNNQNTQSTPLPFSFNLSYYNNYEISCNSLNDGSIELLQLTIPLDTIQWNGPQGYTSSNYNNYNLYAGSYTYTIVDSLGCNYSGSINLEQPDQINYIITKNNPSCYGINDGQVELVINGGASPYIIDWLGFNPQMLGSGTYFFNIIDANGCLLSDTVSLQQPPEILIDKIITNPLCKNSDDGNVDLVINGGNPPFQQDWYGFDPNNLSEGQYYFEISDALNCSVIDSVILISPSQIIFTESVIEPSCYAGNNGSVSIQISGGTTPYTQNWFGINTQSLSAGIYYYEIIDSNYCIETDSIIVFQPSKIQALKEISDPLCADIENGNVILSISGGFSPYSQNWYGYNPTSLGAGIYYFSIIDSNGCFMYDSVQLNNPSQVECTLSLSNQIITATALGGQIPYHFTIWNPLDSLVISNPNNSGSSLLFHPNFSGDYTLIVEDYNGCLDTSIINYTYLPPPLNIQNIKNNDNKELIKIIDLLGREVNRRNKKVLLYLYNDGTIEKKVFID